MKEQRIPTKRWKKRIILAGVALPGVIVAAVAVADQINLRLQVLAIRSADPRVRADSLQKLALGREVRASGAVAETLQQEQDRAALEWAGYAAMRFRDTRNLPLLRRRADEGPDDAVRAKLILYAAQLSGRDVRLIDWLEAGVNSSEPWRQVGSAAGLLALGQPAGGRQLIDLASRAEHPGHKMALAELQRIAGPMAEAVGQPLAWPEPGDEPAENLWIDLRRFWDQWGTVRLLNDVLSRRYPVSPRWHELKRLLHARDKVARWFE